MTLRVYAIASLFLSGVALAQAQPQEGPPRLIRIFREDIKSGKGAAHEKVEAAYVRAFSKSGYPSYLALTSMSGTNQAWFVERYSSYEEMEKAVHLAAAEPLKTTLEQLDAQDGELRSGDHGIIATYQPDMSYVPGSPLGAKARYYAINVVRVRPGHAADFAEMRKIVNAAFEKAGMKQRRAVYSVSSGMPAGTYLILSAMDSLKMMDPPPGAMSMRDAFGADLARYSKMQSDFVISSENTIFSISPKMSNVPKEYVTADADFWAPKVRVSAAKPPAKPAAQ